METSRQLVLDGTKILWHADRIRAWLAGERIAPITIDCALTSSCTYHCVYCYGKLQRMYSGSWTRDMILQFLDDAAEIGVKAISFVSDGESTCSPHLVESIVHGRANGLDMALGTNGYLLNREKLEQILSKLTYCRFNISSAREEHYSHIHGVKQQHYKKVLKNIEDSVFIKKKYNLDVTIGLQMVLMPQFKDEIIPLAQLGRELGVDYLVIKHCSDDEKGQLGVDYAGYGALESILKEAEKFSTDAYSVQVKWSKIHAGPTRCYSHCYGPPFILQISGSGLVAPCGMLFNDKYKQYHIGSLKEHTFKSLWQSERYWKVINMLANSSFDARKDCGFLCLQHTVNEILCRIMERKKEFSSVYLQENSIHQLPPKHINFI